MSDRPPLTLNALRAAWVRQGCPRDAFPVLGPKAACDLITRQAVWAQEVYDAPDEPNDTLELHLYAVNGDTLRTCVLPAGMLSHRAFLALLRGRLQVRRDSRVILAAQRRFSPAPGRLLTGWTFRNVR